MAGGAGGKRAVFDVAAANLSRKRIQILTSFSRQPTRNPETTALYHSRERFPVCPLFCFTSPGRCLFPLSLFLVLTCAVSDCVRIRDKSRASFIAPGFGAGTSISIETSALIDPGPSNRRREGKIPRSFGPFSRATAVCQTLRNPNPWSPVLPNKGIGCRYFCLHAMTPGETENTLATADFQRG